MKSPSAVLERTFNVFLEGLRQVPDIDLPELRFWHLGELAYDGELFAVHAQRIYPGLPGQETVGYQNATGGIVMYAIEVGITILREAVQIDNAGRFPLDEAITTQARRSADDAAALCQVFFAGKASGELIDACDTNAFGNIVWSGPEGGITETTLTYSVQL